MNEGIEQIDKDLAKQLKQQGPSGPIDCALLGRKVSQAECASKSLSACQDDFARCVACPHGMKVAATSPFARGGAAGAPGVPSLGLIGLGQDETSGEQASQQEPSGQEPDSAQELSVPAPALHGWELVKARTGFESHSQLAKKIKKAQPSVSLALRTAATGKMPGGPTVQAILAYAGITMEDLMGRPLTPEERGEAPAEEAAPPATSTQAAADLDVAMSHAEPGTQAEADLRAARVPADIPPPVCPSGLAGASLEALLGELRTRLPGVAVTIQIPA